MTYLTSKIFILFSYIIIFSTIAYAEQYSCPREAVIKSAHFVVTKQSPYDSESWNFISNSFESNGLTWNVVFGSFFPDVKNKQEALQQGQAFFNKVDIIDKNPTPLEIPNHLTCIYVPNGHSYWISALSPPGE